MLFCRILDYLVRRVKILMFSSLMMLFITHNLPLFVLSTAAAFYSSLFLSFFLFQTFSHHVFKQLIIKSLYILFAVFQPDPEGKLNIGGPRLVFCLLHAGGLAFALYRIHLMGLLPTHLSDWIAVIQAPATNDLAVTGLLRGPWG